MRRRSRPPALPEVDAFPGRRTAAARVLPRFVLNRQKRHQREIAPAGVEAVEETELLRAVRGVFGDIDVDRDAPRTRPPLAMTGDYGVGQRLPQTVERSGPDGVLEARDRGLRRQSAAGDRIPIEQEFLNGIVRQSIRIVGIRVAARDPEDPLRQDVGPGMRHPRRGAPVCQHLRQRTDQVDRAVRRFQQHGPPSELACA